MDEVLRQEIAKLRQSKVKELRVRYRELFGEESPSSNRMHLFRRVAWRLQAREAGEHCTCNTLGADNCSRARLSGLRKAQLLWYAVGTRRENAPLV